MKTIVMSSILVLFSSMAFAGDCDREASLEAFRAVIADKELALADMNGFGIQQSGVHEDSVVGDVVTATVSLTLIEKGFMRSSSVEVVLNKQHHNACDVTSSKIVDTHSAP